MLFLRKVLKHRPVCSAEPDRRSQSRGRSANLSGVLALACLWAFPALAQTPNQETDAAAPETSAMEPAGEAEAPPPVPELPGPPAELPAPIPEAFEPPAGDIHMEDWNRDDWMLLKPAVHLIELDGYFRVRADMFRRLDFENRSDIEQSGPRYPEVSDSADFVGTNIRLRLEPRINVTDKIQIVTTLDVLDNLVLGSTPNTIPTSGASPVNILATGQNAPSNLSNALTDSILVKRAYARMTALNEQLELRIGRMPNHWGLGMFANSGDCLDCDYGDITDRVALTFRAAGHLFTPMFDWVASGPLATPFGRGSGQALDALDGDDVDQFGLQVERLDHPEDIRERVSRGEPVINYGAWALFRTQSSGVESSYYEDEELTDANTSLDGLQQNTYDPSAELTADIESRDGFVMGFDAYGKLFVGDFELAAEAALIWGYFKDTLIDTEGKLLQTDVYQLGAAFEGTWYFPGLRPSRLTLKLGGASGDSMSGWGALDAADTQRGRINGRIDNELENFQFSPDYHVDLLMFRRIIGTVTDAWYVRPGVTYMFDENFAGSLAAIYSQAIFRRTTPGGELPMGIEFDAEISYGLENTANPSPFGASIVGGIAVPLGAFNLLSTDDEPEGGDFAWTVQGRLYVTF